jgi:(2Fe-2S) ferredoxin
MREEKYIDAAIIGYYRSGMAMELMVYYSGKDEAEINKIIDDHLKNKKQPPKQ